MGSSLQQTKRRISSVNSTKKITNAMRLVSSAKLKTYKKLLGNYFSYADELCLLMNNLLQVDQIKEELAKMLEGNHSSKTLYIVVTSTLGLCGGYNYNLYKKVVPELTKDDLILVIGTKGVSYFKNNNYQVDDSFALLLSNFDYEEVIKLRRYLMTKLQNNEIGKIKIAYTYFKNSITFIPRVEDIYPLENKEEKISFKEKSILIEPNPTKVIDNLLPLYIDNMLYSRFVQSLVSEYASRSNAMESATDNASEIIDKLQIDYNKARQQAITQEITEIVSGANAQK